MLVKILKLIVEYIAYIHDFIKDFLVNNFGLKDDKMMHFYVIGIIGFILMVVLKPIIKFLVEHKMIVTIDFIYCFSFIVVLTFAIEIGQKITGTGNMEFADITYGIGGFLCFALIYAIIYVIVKAIKESLNKKNTK
jgi:hypothetical protein